MNRFKDIWSDAVWSKVISVGILALIGILYTSFQGWWPAIGGFLQEIIAWTFDKSSIPNWFLAILCLSTLFSVSFFGMAIVAHLKRAPDIPAWRAYTQDTFFDIVWRWNYENISPRGDGLYAFCPQCDCRLSFEDESSSVIQNYTICRCDRCNKIVAQFDFHFNQLLRRVANEIDRKIRNGLWIIESSSLSSTLSKPTKPKMKLPSYESSKKRP